MSTIDFQNIPLGKHTTYAEKYDKKLLFRIPRSENRAQYEIAEENLPFVGFDSWNCYELSFQTDNGLPVTRVMKMVYPSDSKYIVVSKSLKLYLNSFNMDRFGKTKSEAENTVSSIVKKDLSELLETTVQLSLFTENSVSQAPFSTYTQVDICDLIPIEVQEKMEFLHFKESPNLLKCSLSDRLQEYKFRSDLLRSNCRVTNQPDWGDLFVYIQSKYTIDLSSVLEYLISFRKENHFHEEVVEMIYKRCLDIFKPENLMVAAMYTRRGGIDINPIRATNIGLIDRVMIDPHCRMEKTLRQ